MFLSVFIPFYNEEKRLKNSAETVYSYLLKKIPPDQFEFLLVNDGSSDSSLAIAQEFLRKAPPAGGAFIRIISHDPPNLGKGWAVREGMLNSKGDWVLFLDCDLATPIEELDKFMPYLQPSQEGFLGKALAPNSYLLALDILIGTRRIKESQVEVRQPLYRELMGKVFYYLTRLLLSIKVSDVTCGFKCYSRLAIQRIFPQQKLLDWSFDAEDLFLAQKQNLKIKEIPVLWQDKNMSRVRVIKDTLQSLQGLMAIRINDWSKKDGS